MSIKSLRTKADKLWYQKCIKLLCEVCGQEAIQVHHFYYKGSYGHLRYDTDNGISLCAKCHFLLHFQDPKAIEEKIVLVRGQDWYSRLNKKSKEKHENYINVKWYKNAIEKL